jgi:hypothetical protein
LAANILGAAANAIVGHGTILLRFAPSTAAEGVGSCARAQSSQVNR